MAALQVPARSSESCLTVERQYIHRPASGFAKEAVCARDNEVRVHPKLVQAISFGAYVGYQLRPGEALEQLRGKNTGCVGVDGHVWCLYQILRYLRPSAFLEESDSH